MQIASLYCSVFRACIVWFYCSVCCYVHEASFLLINFQDLYADSFISLFSFQGLYCSVFLLWLDSFFLLFSFIDFQRNA
jgi:hypothetical protein